MRATGTSAEPKTGNGLDWGFCAVNQGIGNRCLDIVSTHRGKLLSGFELKQLTTGRMKININKNNKLIYGGPSSEITNADQRPQQHRDLPEHPAPRPPRLRTAGARRSQAANAPQSGTAMIAATEGAPGFGQWRATLNSVILACKLQGGV